MASSVKALLRALGVVPIQAVPDTVDAFLLATGTPHAELLSSLVTEISEMLLKETSIPNDITDAKVDFLKALLMAILHLFKDAGEGEHAMPKIIWVVCVPLLQKSTVSTAAFHNIVAQMLAEMFISKNAWKYAQVSLVPYLLKPVELILWREKDATGICQSNDVHTDEIASLNLIDDERPRICKPLKFYVVCHIVAVLLSEASNHMEIKPLDKKDSCTSTGDAFCIDVISRFFNPMLSVISQTKDDTERKCAIKVLLPPVLKAIQKLNQNMHRGLVESFQRDLWENLKSLFSQGSLQKEDTYFALDLASEFLLFPFINEQNHVENQMQGFNIWHEIEFWNILKSGLVDDEPLTRKRAVHILRAALSAGFACKSSTSQELTDWKGQKSNPSVSSLTKRDRHADVEARSLGLWDCEVERWKAFVLLYDMLEEYGTHLVEAAWNHQITLLLPTLCGKDIKIEASVDCLQHKGKWHLQDLDASIWWMTALWERGFKHDNPQVRRLILQSYMDLDWAKIPKLALAVPKSFVLGPLLSTFNDPIHHKDFGVKGIYSSEMAKAAANFFRLYSKSLETWDRADFGIKMAGELCSKALCRPGFMTLVMCLEASALSGHVTMSDDYEFSTSMDMIHEKSHCVNVSLDMPDSTKCRAAEILDGLGPLVEDSKKHFNPKYRLKVCYHLLRAASSLVLLPEVPFTKFFWFVGLFPQEFVGHEGMLHKHIWNWLRSASNKVDSFSLFEFQTWMTQGLHEIADAFLKPPRCGVEIIVTDEEVEAWTQEADKWARVVSLGFLEPRNLSRLMMFLHEHASKIYQRAYNSTCVPEKLLLLLDNIIKICPSLLKHSRELTTTGGLPKGTENQFDFVALTGNTGCSLDGIRKHLQSIVSMNMSELLAHARRASSVFWNYDFSSCGALPSSVIGKLGGPSQRRLPASVASDALKGVIAVGAVADCIAWSWGNLCSEISDSAVLFIWEFAWKSMNVRAAKEEMEGEIQLSLYEALASVCNALALSLSPHVLSVVKQTVPFGETKDERVLDILVWNLLENINCLLQSRILARSRRAGLLQQKWWCLDGLLSIPRSRVYSIDPSTHSNVPAISDSILKAVLLDAISSLESAGEDNVLPLLRCVRWLMHWNILQRIYAMDPSCESKKGVEVMWSLVRAAWAAVADCNKRRVASIAAFLSAIIHPNVFRESSMHYNNGDDGPLKWLLCRLLDQGSRSPRTMRLTAMHVAGLWLEYPAVTEHYIEELKLLSLHGGESIDEELDGQISENPVAAREYFTLMQSLDPELVEEFRNSELYVRVTVAVLVHKLAEIVEKAWLSGEPEARLGAESASNCGRKLIMKLLNSLANDADLSKELYKKKSAIHRRKTRAWQMTCILSRFVDNNIVKEVVGLLQICLLKNNLPSVRQYAEIFAIQVCLRFPHLVKEKIVSALADYNMKTQALASYVFISVNVLMHATPVSLQNKLIEEVVPAVMPYFTTHHHPLRSFSQILIYEVLHKILKISPDSVEQDKDLPSSLEKTCLQSIVSYLDGNTDCKRIRTAVEKFLNSFDPSTAATPRGIFSIHIGGEEDPSKPLEDIPFECTPIALMDKVSFFLNEAREDLRHSMAADAFALHSEEMSNDKKVLCNHSREEQVTPLPATVKNSKSTGDGPCNFQRKIGSLRFTEISTTDSGERMPENKAIRETFSSLLSVMEREEELLHTTIHSRMEDLSKMRGNRQELIVVATLLGRIPNLAGLARTCEVFKASSLVLADASITQDRQFQLISVTAEMWVPIKEVPEASLQEYLAGKMKAGYTLVGLEQTANSISLEKYKFPKKTVLVLGKEKEGIPIDIIQNLDACVEIPQLGVIRSLNVHVSGAIAVWEYTRQYLDKPQW